MTRVYDLLLADLLRGRPFSLILTAGSGLSLRGFLHDFF